MKDELLRLAERCEQAVGPDRVLDADISLTQGWHECAGDNWIGPLGEICIPVFTASIDTALSLVPSDMRDEIEITTLYRVARVSINMNHGPDGSPFYGSNECNSIPLAICAASLRARASMEQSQ